MSQRQLVAIGAVSLALSLLGLWIVFERGSNADPGAPSLPPVGTNDPAKRDAPRPGDRGNPSSSATTSRPSLAPVHPPTSVLASLEPQKHDQRDSVLKRLHRKYRRQEYGKESCGSADHDFRARKKREVQNMLGLQRKRTSEDSGGATE